MISKVECHDGARNDFDEAVDWYIRRSVGAAIGFIASVDDAIDRISADPERFAPSIAGCRSCSLRKYPFRLVYRVEDVRLIIIAVAHAKRRPGYWHNRL